MSSYKSFWCLGWAPLSIPVDAASEEDCLRQKKKKKKNPSGGLGSFWKNETLATGERERKEGWKEERKEVGLGKTN